MKIFILKAIVQVVGERRPNSGANQNKYKINPVLTVNFVKNLLHM